MKRRELLILCFVAGCNYDTGECYLRGEDGNGAGGGVIAPPGTGGFGDVPPEPQDANDPPPPPECLQVPPGPCYQQCLAKYSAAADQCTSIADQDQRRVCQASAYVAYKTCWAKCQQTEKTCTDMYDACQDKGLPCTRQTKWGTTLCAVCLEDCNADAPYRTNECFKCGFN